MTSYFYEIGIQVAQTEVEIKSQCLVQPQLIAGGDAATHQVALLACFGELVVELSGLEHRAQIPGFLLTHIVTHFRSHFPECIAVVLVAPRP